MKRLLIPALAMGALSCSAVSSFRNGDPMGGAAQLADKGVEAAQKKAAIDAKCKPLGEGDISYVEERGLGGSLAVAAALHLGGLRIAPTTEKSASALSHPETLRGYPPDHALNQLTREVARVGAKLGARSSRPELFWTFAVVDDPAVNAYSAPGGYVFVSRGLLQAIHTEDELAGVLGHEITHVANKDAVKAYLQEKVWGCEIALYAQELTGQAKTVAEDTLRKYGVDAGAAAGVFERILGSSDHSVNYNDDANRPVLKLLAGHLTETLAAGYAKGQEFAADQGAVVLASHAGYDATPFIALVRTLGSDGSYLSHHPASSERADRMAAQLKQLRKDDPFIDWEKISKGPVKLSSAITRGLAGSAVASEPASAL